MKCPGCGKEGAKYIHKKKMIELEQENKIKEKVYSRESNEATCNQCKWKGKI